MPRWWSLIRVPMVVGGLALLGAAPGRGCMGWKQERATGVVTHVPPDQITSHVALVIFMSLGRR
jgi:hypothetical protein